jgi:hypothetical protein
MTIDWTKPIETIAGYPARVLSTDFRSDGKEIVAVQIEYKNCSEINCYTQDGQICGLGPHLRNRKTKRERWINIYPNESEVVLLHTKEDAILHARQGVIATIKIEWEE